LLLARNPNVFNADDLVEAEALFRKAIPTYERLRADDPSLLTALVEALHDWGYLLAFNGRRGEAEPMLRRAAELGEEYVLVNPTDDYHKVVLSNSLNSLGIVLRQTGRAEEAVLRHRRALELLSQLGGKYPELEYRGEQARGLGHMGLAQTVLRQFSQAEQTMRKAIQLRTALFSEQPAVGVELALNHVQLAGIMLWLDEPGHGEIELREAISIFDAVLVGPQEANAHSDDLTHALHLLGNLLADQKRNDEAKEIFAQLELLPAETPLAKNAVAWHLSTCPLVEFRDPARAVALAHAAVATRPSVGQFWTTLGVALFRNESWEEATLALETANHLQIGRNDPIPLYFLAIAYWRIGEIERANELFDQAVTFEQQIQVWSHLNKRYRDEAARILGVSAD
jgi:tetratricopeptide (TPR) repeat protein